MWSPTSLEAKDRLRGRMLASSEDLGWRSVLARSYEEPAEAEEVTTLPTPDFLVVLQLRGSYRIESRRGPRWVHARYRPGSMGATAPGNTASLRWRDSGPTRARTLHLHLDPTLVDTVADELAPGRTAPRLPDALDLDDPVARATGRALAASLEARDDALCADSLATALTARMVALASGVVPEPRRSRPRALAEPAVARVVDYMTDHLAEPVDLDTLTGIAATSKYHFVRSFAAATGMTPYRYLTRLRLERAARLLSTTDRSVAEIAHACGYATASQLSALFRRHVGASPREFRARMGP